MGSSDVEEQEAGRQAASRVWQSAEIDDALANWLRTECGGETLEMVRSAGLELVGGALSD